jgi:hypothetical protein
MRDFLELVALRFFSHLGEEPLEKRNKEGLGSLVMAKQETKTFTSFQL